MEKSKTTKQLIEDIIDAQSEVGKKFTTVFNQLSSKINEMKESLDKKSVAELVETPLEIVEVAEDTNLTPNFQYQTPGPKQALFLDRLRQLHTELWTEYSSFSAHHPRYYENALNSLEETAMWMNKSIIYA